MTRRCPTSGCGSLTALVDATAARSNTWIRVQPARQPHEARWYCTALCAAAALTEATADPVDADRHASAAAAAEASGVAR